MKRADTDLRKNAEATERQAERAKRSNAEQLALLDTRPGESKRERARLTTEVPSEEG